MFFAIFHGVALNDNHIMGLLESGKNRVAASRIRKLV